MDYRISRSAMINVSPQLARPVAYSAGMPSDITGRSSCAGQEEVALTHLIRRYCTLQKSRWPRPVISRILSNFPPGEVRA